jgi:hypothetical protein
MKRTLIAAIRHTRAAQSLECGLALKNLPGKSCVFEATGHSRAAPAGREDRQPNPEERTSILTRPRG